MYIHATTLGISVESRAEGMLGLGLDIITIELADSPAIWPTHFTAPVYMPFDDTVCSDVHAPNSGAEWSLLAPEEGLSWVASQHGIRRIHVLAPAHTISKCRE